MHFLSTITALTGLITMVLANSCNQDNCYRAIKRYETTSSAFCKQYLATPTNAAPTPFATCGPTRISSACKCLETQTPPPPTTTAATTTKSSTSSFVTSTCSRSSASACPTPVNPCCQYLCAVAQVPFRICSPSDTSGQFEVCSKCPVPTAAP
ncbi:hypothetical protein XANCAGTX0491_000243 [Xanthoria calcicola]